VEIAKLLGGLSVAIMSMSVVTYALAIPRLQTALSLGIKRNHEKRDLLTKRIKDESLSIDQIADQLKASENEQNEIKRVVKRLSWNRVVAIPVTLASVALGLGGYLIGFSGLTGVYELALFGATVAFLSGAFLHLLLSLRLVEQTAIRPGLGFEG